MTTAFISDIHLNAERPASLQMFGDFLRAAPRVLSRLYILGDLFDYWVGDDGGASLGHHAAESELRIASDAGVEIFFMHGNRDFLIGDDFAKRTGCKLLPDPTLIKIDDREFLLTHGDALCTDDTEHQTSRKEMLSSKWKMAFLQQPLATRIETAEAMREQSDAAKKQKSMTLMDVNQTAVETLMREHNADTLIHGHTHQPAVHSFQLNNKPAWRYVLGDWFEKRSALYYEKGTLGFKR